MGVGFPVMEVSDGRSDATAMKVDVTSKKILTKMNPEFLELRMNRHLVEIHALPDLSLRARDFFEYSINRGSNTTTTISLSQQLPTLW